MKRNYLKNRVLSNAIMLSRKQGLGAFQNGAVSLRAFGSRRAPRELRSHHPAITLAQAVRSACPHLSPPAPLGVMSTDIRLLEQQRAIQSQAAADQASAMAQRLEQ